MSPWFLFVFFIATYAVAYSDDDISLETILVSAKKNVSDFNFSSTEKISSIELDNQPLGLIAPLLSQFSGVVANQNGGPGGRVSFFIRGTESRHVAFTLDGLKLNDPSNTDRQFDSAFLSAPFIKNIEVHKGPQAVLFGSDAMGGLVEITSRKGEEAPLTRVNINGGSFGTVDTSISNDWVNKHHRGTLTGYRFHTDGLSRLNKKRFNATERDSSDITQLSSSSKHNWHPRIDTDFLFSFSRGENELDGNSTDLSNDSSVNDQYLAQQKTNLRLNENSAVAIRNGLNRNDRSIDIEFKGANTENLFQGTIFQNESLYKFQNDSFNFLGGLSTEHEKLNTKGVNRNFDLHSLFLQAAYKTGTFKVFAGSRAEKHVRYGRFYTGSAGAAIYQGIHTFFMQYSQGFKAPSLYQLYGPSFPGFIVGNPNLVPEVNHAWEGGWQMREKQMELNITVFQNRLSNLITYLENLGYFNQDRFIAEGIELAGKLKHKFFLLSSSFTHQRFRKQESSVIGRPLNSFTSTLAVFPNESSELSLKGKWFSARTGQKDLNNNVKLNGYEAFDIGYRYLFSNADVGIQILNILNREYEELYGYSVMPRSIFVHTGFKF